MAEVCVLPSSLDAALRKLTSVPFAVGEEFASKWQFVPFIEQGLTNFCRVDICNVGGITETMKVAGWCEAHYIDLMPHNPLGPVNTAACVHVGLSCPNFCAMEVFQDRTFDDSIFTMQHQRQGTHYPVPTAPGLGVEVNEAALIGMEYSPPKGDLFLRRRDGSVTNW